MRLMRILLLLVCAALRTNLANQEEGVAEYQASNQHDTDNHADATNGQAESKASERHRRSDAMLSRRTQAVEHPASKNSQGFGDALRAFLRDIQFEIAPQTLPESSTFGQRVKVDSMKISHVDLAHIASVRYGSSLKVRLDGMTGSSKGSVSWSGWTGKRFVSTVNFEADLSEAVLDFTVSFDSHPHDGVYSVYPESIRVSDCQLNLKSLAISFTNKTNMGGDQRLVKSSIEYVLNNFVCPEVEEVGSKEATEMLQDLTGRLTGTTTTPAPQDLHTDNMRPYLNMRDVDVLQWIDDLVKWDVRVSGFNKMMGMIMTGFGQGSKLLNLMPLNFSSELHGPVDDPVTKGKVGDLEFNISNLTIIGLDGFKDISLPDLERARDTVSLGLTAGLGNLSTSMDVDIRFVPTASFGGRDIVSKVRLAAGIENLEVMMHFAAFIIKSMLSSRSRKSALCPECILPALSSASFSNFGASFDLQAFQLMPIAAALDSLEGDIDWLINNIVDLLAIEFRRLPSDGLTLLMMPHVKSIVDTELDRVLGEARKSYLTPKQMASVNSGSLAEPAAMCKTDYTMHSGFFKFIFFVVVGAVVAVLFLAWQVWKPLFESRAGRVSSVARLPWECLAGHTSVPIMLSFTVPCVILAAIFTQLWTHSMVQVEMLVRLTRNGQEIALPPYEEFSVGSLIEIFWNGGEIIGAILELMLCGIFPYAKLFALLLAWLLPITWLPIKRRGELLRIIDAIGKWSFLDIFITAFSVASMHFVIRIGRSTIEQYAHPLPAFYVATLVTVVTTVCGHVTLGCHECCPTTVTSSMCLEGTSHERELDGISGSERNLKRMSSRSVRSKILSAFSSCPDYSTAIVPCLLLSAFICFTIGISVDIISFELHGLLRSMIADVGGGEVNASFSVLSLASALPNFHGDSPDGFNIQAFQVLIVGLVVFAEAVYMAVLLIAYVFPVDALFRKSFLAFARVSHAWAALDVFVLTAIAGSFQIATLVQLIIGSSCDMMKVILAEYFSDQIDEPVCFRLQPHLRPGIWILLLAAAMSKYLGYLTMNALQEASDELDAERAASANGRGVDPGEPINLAVRNVTV